MNQNQLNLFDIKDIETVSNKSIVQIAVKSNQLLTKEQKRFNKLTKTIEELENDILNLESNLQQLMEFYTKELEPIEEKKAATFINLAFFLDKLSDQHKFSKNTLSQINNLIVNFLDLAFERKIANQEEIDLYDRYNEVAYEEEKQAQIKEMKSRMEQAFYYQHNVDIDLSDLNVEDPEEMARFQKKMEEQIKENERINSEKKNSKKKTKKQLEKEQLEKAKAEAQKKDLKSIYLSLSKALHPDTETDSVLKLEKEELMKRVTVAYQNKDLPQLLKLELEWVQKTNDHLNDLSEAQLKIYNSLLQDRLNELQNKRLSTLWSPRFEKIQDYTHSVPRVAISKIKTEIKEAKKRISILEKNLDAISKTKKKKEISELVDFMHVYHHSFYDAWFM